MVGARRSKIQLERDRLTISELHLKGWSQQRIADHLEVDKSTICREIKKIKAAWKAEVIEDHDILVKQELRRLAMLEAEYWDAWQRSQQQRDTSFSERLATGKNEAGEVLGRIRQATKSEQKVGEAVFLNGIQRVVDSRCKLLGLFPEEKSGAGSAISFSDQQVSVLSQLMQVSDNTTNASTTP